MFMILNSRKKKSCTIFSSEFGFKFASRVETRFVSRRLASLVLSGCRKKPSLLHRWQADPCTQRFRTTHCSRWPGDFVVRSWEVLCTVASCKEPWMASSPEAWAKPVAFWPSALAAGPQHHQTDALSCTQPALGRLLHGCFLQTVLIWKTFSATGDSEETPTINHHNAEINTQLMYSILIKRMLQ